MNSLLRPFTLVLSSLIFSAIGHSAESLPGRWSAEKANAWYEAQPWPVGANFVPSTAINQLEMWQADTFDPATIARELGWAAAIGMNTMRVFLHDLAWSQDPEGFLRRVDHYLALADRHQIKTMFVLWDSVWNPEPRIGRQPEPRPRVHNSGWVQSPGKAILGDPARHASLQPYVTAVLTRFKDDPRVHSWDLFNEPDNANAGNFGGDSAQPDLKPAIKRERAAALLAQTFAWARAVNPTQPLTAGVWGPPTWFDKPDPVDTLCFEHSDIITFHTYHNPAEARPLIEKIAALGRPALCTEFMARGNGSTFAGILPLLKQHRIGAYCWGLVDGKSQTIYPWDSWKKTYTAEPEPWFHDVFRRDGTPYLPAETDLIRALTR